MRTIDIFRFNGLATGVETSALVDTKMQESASSTENNSTNSWNVNFSTITTNTNNKYNGNYIRAVAALDGNIKEGWVEAFHDCCRKKLTSRNCNEYRGSDYESDLWALVNDVYSGNYNPGKSVCFCVKKPRVREIFAADFRDRIVQHWISIRLMPIFEQRHIQLGDRSYNCRTGYGTSYASGSLIRDIELISENYTKDAYVAKIDVRSFFMSIDVNILWKFLEPFIREKYTGDDIDTLLYLTKITLFHRPQDNCEKRGNLKLWEVLPPHKSLFNNAEGKGLAIGNITSQIWANFYMSFYLEEMLPWVKSVGGRIGEFVDDISFVAPRKEDCITFREKSCKVLKNLLNLKIHPDKFYVQHVKKGVVFVGLAIKPGRKHVTRRTMGNFADALYLLENAAKTNKSALREIASVVNSYLGFMCETNDYRQKTKLIKAICNECLKYCRFTNYAKVLRMRNNLINN